MKMDLGLQVKQTQSLIMTPQLQQAIKLLQLSRYELEQLIDQSLIENPALESDAINDEMASENESRTEDDPWEAESEESYLENEMPAKNDEPDEWEEYINEPQDFADGLSKKNQDDEPQNILENTVTQKESLASHLIWQINLSFEDETEKNVAATIVSYIDKDGYLGSSVREMIVLSPFIHEWSKGRAENSDVTIPEDEIQRYDEKYVSEKNRRRKDLSKKLIKNVRFEANDAEERDIASISEKLSADAAEIPDAYCFFVERILRRVQQLDPNGVAARNIRECLLIQLEAMDMKNMLPYFIVRNDFQSLIRNDIHRLHKKYATTFSEIQSACRIIRELEPKPGRPFSEEATQYIIPDVFIQKIHGEYKVRLNADTLPRLRVSPQYLEMAKKQHAINLKLKKKKNSDGEDESDLTEAYLNEKIRAGEWLIKSIDQRQRTIFKVAESILKYQKDFFENGISALKPMILKVIADDIGVHESTVSRITNNKFVHTPQGIFELKFFFTSGVAQEDGDTISSKKIKNLIQQLIQKENPKKPYTDHHLVIELERSEKIKIARRTVAKYRESMNILPSNRRKKVF